MAQTDNLLGAPTEGLGQNVTFGFNTPGSPQLGAGGPAPVRGGISGGNPQLRTQGVGVDSRPASFPILDTIMQISGGVAQRQMQQMRTEQFFKGMQRAANGEAVTDIAKDNPWYAKLFGDSDAVEGARAYTSATKAQTVVAGMEEDMPKLRMLSPDEANKYFIQKINDAQTGDTATDMAVMQQFTQSMPALMKRQAKENYAYVQGEAVKAQSAYFASGASALQTSADGLALGTVSPEDYDAAKRQFLASTAPPVGMDPDKFIAGRTQDMISAARNGQFHALNAMEEAGFLDAMNPQERQRYDSARMSGEQNARGKFGYDFAGQLADIKAVSELPTLSPDNTNDLGTKIDLLNQQWQAKMGTKNSYYITPEQKASMMAGHTVAVARLADQKAAADTRAAAKADAQSGKAAASQALDLNLTSNYEAGTLFSTRGEGVTTDKKDEIAQLAFNNEPDPQKRAELVVRNFENSGKVSMPLQHQLIGSVSAAIRSGNVDDKVQRVFSDYNTLRTMNKFAADALYGDMAPKLEAFRQATLAGFPVEGAFNQVFMDDRKESVGAKDWKAAGAEITSKYNGFFARTFGEAKAFLPGQLDGLIADNARNTSSWAGQMGPGKYKEAAVRAVGQKISSGKAEIIGGTYYTLLPDQQPVGRWLVHDARKADGSPVTENDVQTVYHTALRDTTYKYTGYWPEDADGGVKLFRLPDQDGKPRFHVYTTHDGETKDFLFTGEDIIREANRPKPVYTQSHRSPMNNVDNK